MTKFEFMQEYWQTVHDELEFLYYSEFIKWQNDGNKWHTFPPMRNHCRKFKKQLLAHVYANRSFDLGELSYK